MYYHMCFKVSYEKTTCKDTIFFSLINIKKIIFISSKINQIQTCPLISTEMLTAPRPQPNVIQFLVFAKETLKRLIWKEIVLTHHQKGSIYNEFLVLDLHVQTNSSQNKTHFHIQLLPCLWNFTYPWIHAVITVGDHVFILFNFIIKMKHIFLLINPEVDYIEFF
jgi:hypothetical protein